jgi:hypothetical protein
MMIGRIQMATIARLMTPIPAGAKSQWTTRIVTVWMQRGGRAGGRCIHTVTMPMFRLRSGFRERIGLVIINGQQCLLDDVIVEHDGCVASACDVMGRGNRDSEPLVT